MDDVVQNKNKFLYWHMKKKNEIRYEVIEVV